MITDMVTLAVFDAASLFQWVVDNASYLLVFLLMTVESTFIPFPSEVIVPPAAYLCCTRHDMNVAGVVAVATAGAIFGALINYYLSLWIGRPLVYRFADSRVGHACLLDRAKVDKAERYFDKHGCISTFIGRLVPVVRQLISIPAGLSRMNVWLFILYTGLGALVWNVVLAILGYSLGKAVPPEQLFTKVEEYNQYLTWLGYGIGIICVGIIVWSAFKPRRNDPADPEIKI